MGDRKATPYFKGMVFLFSIFLHLLIFFGLHSILKHPPKAGGQQTTVFLNLVKPYEPKALESKTTIRADDRKSKARIKQQQPVSVVLAPETTIVDASIDSSQTEKSHVLSKTPQTPQTSTIADEMIAVTKQDIGKIDREIRQTFPQEFLPSRNPVTLQSKLEKGISSAAKPATTTAEIFTFSDGRKMMKITGPMLTYCITKNTGNATDGVDTIQNGIASKTTNCPR